jgi:hypothetical protein
MKINYNPNILIFLNNYTVSQIIYKLKKGAEPMMKYLKVNLKAIGTH